jgi:hypothetical protein
MRAKHEFPKLRALHILLAVELWIKAGGMASIQYFFFLAHACMGFTSHEQRTRAPKSWSPLIDPHVQKRLVLPAGDGTVLLVLCMLSSGCTCRRKKQATPCMQYQRARGRHPCVHASSNQMPLHSACDSSHRPADRSGTKSSLNSHVDDANILRDNGGRILKNK